MTLCAMSQQVIPLIGDFQNINLKSEAWDDSTGCDPRRNVLPLLGDVKYLEIPMDLLLVKKSWSREQELRKAGSPSCQG